MKAMMFYVAAVAYAAAGVYAKESWHPAEPMCQCFDFQDMGDTLSTRSACRAMKGSFYDITDPAKGTKWHAPGCYSNSFTDGVALSGMARRCGMNNMKGATCCYSATAKGNECPSQLAW